MKALKKIFIFLLDLIEVYIPMAALITMTVSFLIQIISRYVFKAQLPWTYELTLISFLFCLYFAAPYAQRKDTHVRFDMVYDRLPKRGKFIFRCVGNLFLIFCFALLSYHGTSWVLFMKIQKTSMMHIPLSIVYSPFIVFSVLTLAHTVYQLIHDIVEYFRMEKGNE